MNLLEERILKDGIVKPKTNGSPNEDSPGKPFVFVFTYG